MCEGGFQTFRRVRVNILPGTTLTVRSIPAGTKIGEQPNGAEGTKVGEPKQANGRLWQNVDFDPQGQDSKDGWVAASLIVPISLPTPTPTPTPVAVECAQGEIPPARGGVFTGFEGWYGRDRVFIADGETHTWCFTVNVDTWRVALSVADRTGAAQCFWHTAEFIPPPNSDLKSRGGSGNNSATEWQWPDHRNIPKGTYGIRITASPMPGCTDLYQITAHY